MARSPVDWADTAARSAGSSPATPTRSPATTTPAHSRRPGASVRRQPTLQAGRPRRPRGRGGAAGLSQRWSPEQIAGRLRLDHPDDEAAWVSHETIYQWVYRKAETGELFYQRLRRRHKRRRCRISGDRKGKRGVIPDRVGIEERPEVVNLRERFGDWESDTVEGAKGKGLVATHVERKSRYTLIGKLADKKAATLSRTTCGLMKGLPASSAGPRRSTTARSSPTSRRSNAS